MKIAIRVAVFLAGAGLVVFGWYKAHSEMISLQNPGSTNAINSSEMLVVIGAFIALAAFLPSSRTLGRWMSLKRPRRPQPAHFRRRRQRS
ncbi:MAG TPA: hypothetical protein VL240_08200 [Candidatus Binatia bacterium]|nr:hypothetical protein [Candidatus Binatia bacterium]